MDIQKYIRHEELGQEDKVYVWNTGIGLQAVDGLQTLEYLIEFDGIYSHAGVIRSFNITKKEWVISGDTMLYGDACDLKETLEYDFAKEKIASYQNLSTE